MVKMLVSPRFMGVGSYEFRSGLLMLQIPGGHAGRHRIANPAAHGQQGDHEDEEQMAHG